MFLRGTLMAQDGHLARNLDLCASWVILEYGLIALLKHGMTKLIQTVLYICIFSPHSRDPICGHRLGRRMCSLSRTLSLTIGVFTLPHWIRAALTLGYPAAFALFLPHWPDQTCLLQLTFSMFVFLGMSTAWSGGASTNFVMDMSSQFGRVSHFSSFAIILQPLPAPHNMFLQYQHIWRMERRMRSHWLYYKPKLAWSEQYFFLTLWFRKRTLCNMKCQSPSVWLREPLCHRCLHSLNVNPLALLFKYDQNFVIGDINVMCIALANMMLPCVYPKGGLQILFTITTCFATRTSRTPWGPFFTRLSISWVTTTWCASSMAWVIGALSFCRVRICLVESVMWPSRMCLWSFLCMTSSISPLRLGQLHLLFNMLPGALLCFQRPLRMMSAWYGMEYHFKTLKPFSTLLMVFCSEILPDMTFLLPHRQHCAWASPSTLRTSTGSSFIPMVPHMLWTSTNLPCGMLRKADQTLGRSLSLAKDIMDPRDILLKSWAGLHMKCIMKPTALITSVLIPSDLTLPNARH